MSPKTKSKYTLQVTDCYIKKWSQLPYVDNSKNPFVAFPKQIHLPWPCLMAISQKVIWSFQYVLCFSFTLWPLVNNSCLHDIKLCAFPKWYHLSFWQLFCAFFNWKYIVVIFQYNRLIMMKIAKQDRNLWRSIVNLQMAFEQAC